MCEQCGFVSKTRQAAPVLMEYGKRIEGLWSGYCTGIGVQDADGTLRMGKTLGYSKCWEEKFSIDNFPGTAGLFHSRTGWTGGPGDERYAHPFLSSDGASLGVSQGAKGIFTAECDEAIVRIGNMLLDAGRTLGSADPTVTERYTMLKDGTRVHMSDVVNEYAAYLLAQGYKPMDAVRKVGTDILEESTTMFIFRDYPGHIFVINMNQRLCVWSHEDGKSIATCALAFGDKQVPVTEIPGNCVADITADYIHFETLSPELQLLQEVKPGLHKDFLDWVRKTPETLLAHVMDNALKLHYPADVLRHVPTHEVFEQLYYDGNFVLTTKEYPGVRETDQSIRTAISMK